MAHRRFRDSSLPTGFAANAARRIRPGDRSHASDVQANGGIVARAGQCAADSTSSSRCTTARPLPPSWVNFDGPPASPSLLSSRTGRPSSLPGSSKASRARLCTPRSNAIENGGRIIQLDESQASPTLFYVVAWKVWPAEGSNRGSAEVNYGHIAAIRAPKATVSNRGLSVLS